MGQAGVAGVDAVDGAQLRRPDVVHLVVVATLVPNAVAVQADVGVGVHKPGKYLQARRVEHLGVSGGVQIFTNGGNFAARQQQIDLAGFAVYRVLHQTAADQDGFCLHNLPPLHRRGVFYIRPQSFSHSTGGYGIRPYGQILSLTQ